MRYENLTDEQTKALLDAIRELVRNPPEGELDDAALLDLLPGRVTEGGTDPAPGVDPAPDTDTDPTPQGVFQFSIPTSGWGAESYRVQWGDESVEIAQSRGNRAGPADIETALESLAGVRDVEVTGTGSGDDPYRVELLDAEPGGLRVIRGNGKNARVREVDETAETPPADTGGNAPGGYAPGCDATGCNAQPPPGYNDPERYRELIAERGYGEHNRALRLDGGPDADQLTGSVFGDDLNGAGGNDILDGGLGPDFLTGGPGADIFHFAAGDTFGPDFGDGDVILDFDYAAGDRIRLIGFSGNPTLTGFRDEDDDGFLDDRIISLPDGRIYLLNVGDAELSIENIII